MEQIILIEDYIEDLYIKEEFQYLDEGIKEILSKLTPKVIKTILPKTSKVASNSDLKGFSKLLKSQGINLNDIKPKGVIDLSKKLPSDIQTGAKFAERVISNSIPKASKKMKFAAGYAISVLAKIKKPKSSNHLVSVKSELKNYIMKVQSFYDETEEKASEVGKKISQEDIADIAISVATVVALSTLVGFILWGAISLMAVFIAICAAMVNWAPVIIASLVAAWGIRIVLGVGEK